MFRGVQLPRSAPVPRCRRPRLSRRDHGHEREHASRSYRPLQPRTCYQPVYVGSPGGIKSSWFVSPAYIWPSLSPHVLISSVSAQIRLGDGFGFGLIGSFPDLDEIIPLKGAYLREALAPTNNVPSTSTNPTSSNPTSFFTPEAAAPVNVNGHPAGGGPRMQANPLTFRMNGMGPRDSINSLADSSFGEFNSPGFRGPRTFTADMMLTANVRPPAALSANPSTTYNGNPASRNGSGNGINGMNGNPTASSNDGRPATKRARGEAPARVEAEGNRIARAAGGGKRVCLFLS